MKSIPQRLKPAAVLPVVGLLAAFIAAVIALAYGSSPSFSDTVRSAVGSDRVLLSADGRILQTARTDFNKRRLVWQPLSSFPNELQEAVIEAEDRRFYFHPGIDIFGLTRALWSNFVAHRSRVQGASTITMQVTDLIQVDVLSGQSRIRKGSITRKFAQFWRALGIELKWSKEQILEAYLNLIHLRGEHQGIPALSYAYLKRDPISLDHYDSAVIAAMISSPNQSKAQLKSRACTLHRKMTDPSADCERVFAASEQYFQGRPTLPANIGSAPHLARRLVQNDGASSVISTTIDHQLQEDVIAILERNIHRLQGSRVRDTAAIVIENKTGRVLAYVGAMDTSDNPHVDGVQAYRQAGSSLKPFIYAKGIESKLLTSTSILLDEPTAISWGGGVYRPTNYDRQFYGPVSVREALGSSLNVPSVKAVTIIGLHRTYQLMQSIGLTKLKEPDFYGVSMALGAIEVRLDELANAYRILANGGVWSPLKFTNSAEITKHQVFTPETSFIVSSILSDSNARSIGFGWDSPLETPFWTAVKTGTSKDYRDNWCVGFSSRYTVAVWTGNFNAEAMKNVSGVAGAGPSWYEIMLRLHRNETSSPPQKPDGVTAKKIRHHWSSTESVEYFLAGTEPTHSVIETASEKRPQFVFPAEGSVLVKNPHLDVSHIALFVRFKGSVPANSQLHLDGKSLGIAVSPFKLSSLSSGDHDLSIRSEQGEILTRVKFKVKGSQSY